MINHEKYAKRIGGALIAAAMLAGTAGAVAAKDQYPADANKYYGIYQNPARDLVSDDSDRLSFHESGTRGREGLGAAPTHPEGPGLATD
jgi:hypothetical protein